MAKVTVDTIRNIKGASLERAPKKHTSSSSVTHGEIIRWEVIQALLVALIVDRQIFPKMVEAP